MGERPQGRSARQSSRDAMSALLRPAQTTLGARMPALFTRLRCPRGKVRNGTLLDFSGGKWKIGDNERQIWQMGTDESPAVLTPSFGQCETRG